MASGGRKPVRQAVLGHIHVAVQGQLAQQAGFLDPILQFGAQITVDTCILTTPMLPEEIRFLMTNSAKFAYYAPGLLDKRIAFSSLADCVTSAVKGEIVRDETLWQS